MFKKLSSFEIVYLPLVFSVSLGFLMLHSIAPQVFPQYYAYIVLSLVCFFLFLRIDFETLCEFSVVGYALSIFFLLLPIIIGQVTRGTIRWIPLGTINLQPAEIVRPILILFFASYFSSTAVSLKRIVASVPLILFPLFLIFSQPSLGVAILTAAGILGVVVSLHIKRKYYLWGFLFITIFTPLFWFVLAQYQKDRILTLLSPSLDPSGLGYNSIQSVIAVGSGKFLGRGLGQGVQTQLSFLPEKHTDFMFAAISEELGFLGAIATLFALFWILFRLTNLFKNAISPVRKAYLLGVLATLFLQVFVHVGMNMGILPITGIPLPLISYGGSSLLSTMIMLAIALQAGRVSGKIQS